MQVKGCRLPCDPKEEEEDVTGVLWIRLEKDGGVQGEAGHASSGRLCLL